MRTLIERAYAKRNHEEGFTLIELMIVVVIIGILAAIAIPIFANQQKEAIVATVKSDVKNTVTGIATMMVKKPTFVQADLAYVTPVTSSTNIVTLRGSWTDYRVVGYNTAVPNTFIYYRSTLGKYSETATNPLPTPSGPNYQRANINNEVAGQQTCTYQDMNNPTAPFITATYTGTCPFNYTPPAA